MSQEIKRVITYFKRKEEEVSKLIVTPPVRVVTFERSIKKKFIDNKDKK